jgi:hypothetical protein
MVSKVGPSDGEKGTSEARAGRPGKARQGEETRHAYAGQRYCTTRRSIVKTGILLRFPFGCQLGQAASPPIITRAV